MLDISRQGNLDSTKNIERKWYTQLLLDKLYRLPMMKNTKQTDQNPINVTINDDINTSPLLSRNMEHMKMELQLKLLNPAELRPLVLFFLSRNERWQFSCHFRSIRSSVDHTSRFFGRRLWFIGLGTIALMNCISRFEAYLHRSFAMS